MTSHIIKASAFATQTTVTTECPMCHELSITVVPTMGYNNWRNGEFIQNALSKLTPDQRELLMTGIDAKCWDSMAEDYELAEDEDY